MIATNLKAIRKMRGMTQADLATASSIHRITIARYETGAVEPNIKSAERLAKALGVTVDDLINGIPEDKGA